MNIYQHYADCITFKQYHSRTIVASHHSDLSISGVGRSAAAFRIRDTNLVIKVFFPAYKAIALEEAEIYRLLTGSRYYPALHDSGSNYLVIDYVEGDTLFQCLTNGTIIDERYLKEVDHALDEALQVGLTPSDVHLRNIIVTPQNEIKLIDLARFRQLKDNDHQWENLKNAYTLYRKSYFPKRIPEPILNGIAYVYKKKPEMFQHFGQK